MHYFNRAQIVMISLCKITFCKLSSLENCDHSEEVWHRLLYTVVKQVHFGLAIYVVVVVDPKLLSSLLLYSQCQADESACLLQLV